MAASRPVRQRATGRRRAAAFIFGQRGFGVATNGIARRGGPVCFRRNIMPKNPRFARCITRFRLTGKVPPCCCERGTTGAADAEIAQACRDIRNGGDLLLDAIRCSNELRATGCAACDTVPRLRHFPYRWHSVRYGVRYSSRAALPGSAQDADLADSHRSPQRDKRHHERIHYRPDAVSRADHAGSLDVDLSALHRHHV